ncbi:hypothetical protein ACOMHN_000702 [Nucella lapillus]
MAVVMMGGHITDYMSDVMGHAVSFLKRNAPQHLFGTGPVGQKWNCLMQEVTSNGLDPGNAANGFADYFDTAAETPLYKPDGTRYNPCELVFCGEKGLTMAATLQEVTQRLQMGQALGRLGQVVFGNGPTPFFGRPPVQPALPTLPALPALSTTNAAQTVNNNNNNNNLPQTSNNNIPQTTTMPASNDNMAPTTTTTATNNMAQSSANKNNNMAQTKNNNVLPNMFTGGLTGNGGQQFLQAMELAAINRLLSGNTQPANNAGPSVPAGGSNNIGNMANSLIALDSVRNPPQDGPVLGAGANFNLWTALLGGPAYTNLGTGLGSGGIPMNLNNFLNLGYFPQQGRQL